jgi:hypothetical protein
MEIVVVSSVMKNIMFVNIDPKCTIADIRFKIDEKLRFKYKLFHKLTLLDDENQTLEFYGIYPPSAVIRIVPEKI